MFIIYTLLIRVYYWFALVYSLFNTKAKQWIKGRKLDINSINEFKRKHQDHKLFWVHSASYGEFEMAKPIISELAKNPKHAFVVSFYSPSGFEQITFDSPQYLKVYLPLDTYKAQKKLVDLLKPTSVIFIKYEFWFNLLRVLKDCSIPYYYTSLNLNKDSYLFKSIMKPFLALIKNAKKIYCHNADSQKVLSQHDFANTAILGDTRTIKVLENKHVNDLSLSWLTERPIVVFGSITSLEIPMVISFINTNHAYNYIVALHDIDAITLKEFQMQLKLKFSLYSLPNKQIAQVLVVDTMGDLKYLYKNCDIAYVGGGFEKGPHNLLEPLVYGLPISCGPNIEKFPMAQKLKSISLLRVISSKNFFSDNLKDLMKIEKESFDKRSRLFFENNFCDLDELINDLSLNP